MRTKHEMEKFKMKKYGRKDKAVAGCAASIIRQLHLHKFNNLLILQSGYCYQKKHLHGGYFFISLITLLESIIISQYHYTNEKGNKCQVFAFEVAANRHGVEFKKLADHP
jgi:hypothetical protein